MTRIAVAVLAVAGTLALGLHTATAAGSNAYRDAVQQALADVRDASGSDPVPAMAALSVLEAGTGRTQPEITDDLRLRPPDYADARARLTALLASLDGPASTSDPAAAQQKLASVLAMSRYAALHRPPSLLDRFEQWVGDRVRQLLALLFGPHGAGSVPNWFFFGLGVIALAAVATVVFNSTRGRFRESVIAASPPGPRAPADYFAEADRLAAAGDRVGAIRNLCAGVAGSLAGERTWEGSPLTVREIFQRAPDFASLRALLLPFEAAVYGGRDVDVAAYARAAEVAAHFRQPAQVAA